MQEVPTGPWAGFVCQLALLGGLGAGVGLSGPGWVVGVACAVVTSLLLVRAMVRHGTARLGPAGRVTLTRAILSGGVAALVAASFGGPIPVGVVVGLSVTALVLDGVDGWVARRTGTATVFGARFDMEVDAFLILVLSVYVASTTGWWVLIIGAARYVFVAAGRVVTWLRGTLPPRAWAKVVAAIQGIVLTAASTGVLPQDLQELALGAALLLLSESFGREVLGLWRLHEARRGERGGDLVAAGGVGDG